MNTLIIAMLAAVTVDFGAVTGPIKELTVDDDHGPVLEETSEYVVTPANGVWDAEYGKTEDEKDISFRFKLVRYADGIGVKARVIDDKVVTDNCQPGVLTCPSWDDDNLECFFDGNNDKSKDARAGDGLKYGGEFTFVANGAAQSDFSGWPNQGIGNSGCRLGLRSCGGCGCGAGGTEKGARRRSEPPCGAAGTVRRHEGHSRPLNGPKATPALEY